MKAAKTKSRPTIKTQNVPFLGKVKAKRFKLPNGLRIITVRSRVAPVFAYQTWYDVGSRDEEKGLSGIAHLFEHMMFKETKHLKPGVFDKTMESNGARDLNAFTSTDYTAYVQSLPVKALDLVAGLESERMKNLLLTPKLFESEREVVHNERKQRTENNPDGQMFEELQKIAFPKHPYGRPVIGFTEDLNRMTPDDCRRFYASYYSPNNAVIVVVGDLDPQVVLRTITKHYGKFTPADTRRIEVPAEPAQHGERRKELALNIQVEKVFMGYRIPSALHRDQLALSILGAVLSSGRSSRLYRALVDSGLAIDAGAGPGASKDESLFYVTFSAQAGKTAAECIAAVDKVMQDLADKPISPEELSRAVNKLQTEFYMGMTTNSAKANFIGHNEIVFGDFTRALAAMEELRYVSAEEVRECAMRHLSTRARSLVIGRPEKAPA